MTKAHRPASPLRFTPPERHQLRSDVIGQVFQIDVMLPIRPRNDGRRYPVVYATDGNAQFDALKGISYSLQRTGTDAPPFILVGVGYPGLSPRAGRFLRRRDFTPPGYPELGVLTPDMAEEGEILPPPGMPDRYGADAFIDFFETQLIPFIGRRYPASCERIYFGHSGGALFGLYAFLTRASLFQRLILSSPSIGYDGPGPEGQYIHSEFLAPFMRDFFANPNHTANHLYFSVGSLEEAEAPAWHLGTRLAALVAGLEAARRPGLRIVHEVIAGETHMSVWPIAFIRGVAALLSNDKDLF